MALTLVEGNKYSQTELQGYVLDRIGKSSPVLMHLPFVEILGNSVTYNTKVTGSTAAFRSVGGTWTEDTPVLEQATAALKILGGDADIDNFLMDTRSNKIDLKGEVIDDKIRATKEQFLDAFYYGDDSSNSLTFDGLQVLMSSTTYNTVHAGSSTGTALSILKLQEAIDLVTGYTPTHLLISKQLRRYITVYLDSIGEKFASRMETGPGGFGRQIETFRGLDVIVDDMILNTETASSGAYDAKTGGGNTTAFITTWAPKAICGIQGPNQIQTVPLGDLETKDAQRYRIKWYCGLKFEDLRSAAKVDGIDADGTVTA